jgi:DNA polymerase-3 subunit delta
VGVIRAGLMHVQKLHRCALRMSAGASASEAAKSARPPVFFRALPAFTRSLQALSEPDLRAILARLFEAELACKRTGAPAELICRQLMAQVARMAARRR